MFELMITVDFEAAHRLPEYDGKCCRLHGHNWKVEVFVQGKDLDATGMLIDFQVLKAAVGEVTVTLDHYYLNELPPFQNVNPTAENIAKYYYDKLTQQPMFADNVRVSAVRVWESPRSAAKYRPDAN